MSESEGHESGNPQAVATLRQLKEAESRGQRKLEDARARGEAGLKEAQAAREKLLSDARRDAEALRVRRVRDAVAQADTQKVLAAAQAEAARWGNLTPQEIDARFEEVLAAVLGDLRVPRGKATVSAAR